MAGRLRRGVEDVGRLLAVREVLADGPHRPVAAGGGILAVHDLQGGDVGGVGLLRALVVGARRQGEGSGSGTDGERPP